MQAKATTKKNAKGGHTSEKSRPIPAAQPRDRWLLEWSIGLGLALAAFLLYAGTLRHGYVLDDYSLIKENTVTTQGIHALPRIFRTAYRDGNFNDGVYRPLSKAMFAVEWELAPDKPALGHFINVLIYSLTGTLLFFTLTRYLPGNLLVPFLTTALFLAHPIHTEVVANIKGRDELMCFFFLLIACWRCEDR
jgi:hypothetical protein